MVHAIINGAVGDVFASARNEQINDFEFRNGEIDIGPVPDRAIAVRTQDQLAALKRFLARRSRDAATHLHDEAQALSQNRDAPRLVHEIDGTAIERGIFVGRGRYPREKHDGQIDAPIMKLRKEVDAEAGLQLPVKDDHVRIAVPLQVLQHRLAAGQGDDLEAEMLELGGGRLAVIVVIVDQDEANAVTAARIISWQIGLRTRRCIVAFVQQCGHR